VIMEYVSGPSLREILDESPEGLGIDQAKFFLRELAKGLSYLHEAGVVHRDLKPHNVFFENGIVKIGDYSLSKVMTASHRSGNTMTVGSVHYMAPEISLGRYDKTVDIYALGVMLHEMLTGQPPHVGESMGEVLMKHLSSDPDVSQLPEPFAGVVLKAMQRDPANRYQTAEEMIAAVAGTELARQLDDSFNPATLSLVGERARKLKAEQTVSQTAPQIAPAMDHSTAPTAVQETGVFAGTDDVTAVKRLPWLHRIGLHYSPPGKRHNIPDSTPLVLRLFLAAVATVALILLSLKMSGSVYRPRWTWADVLSVLSATFLLSTTTTLIACRFFTFQAGIAAALLSRIGWTLPVALAWSFFVVVNMPTYSDELSGPIASVLVICTFLFDWRCLIAAHRYSRVSLLQVGAIGATAVLYHMLLARHDDLTPFAAAIAISSAITVQLVAPMRRAASDAPVTERSLKPRKPRLLFDRTSMFLELVTAACGAIVVAIVVSGTNEEELMVIGVIAAFASILALRFRLQRRAWPDGEPWNSRLRFDGTAVFLEFLIAGCAVVATAVMVSRDDDVFWVAAVAIAIAVVAIRFRLARRVGASPQNVGEADLAEQIKMAEHDKEAQEIR